MNSFVNKIFFGVIVFTLLFVVNTNAQKNQSTGFHDLTARYNYFFNSKLNLKESLKEIAANQEDNFEELLLVEKEGTEESKPNSAPNMDEIIKKSATAIQLHNISKWVDDHHLLIGKAHYYKGDYASSLENLQYVINEFSDKKRVFTAPPKLETKVTPSGSKTSSNKSRSTKASKAEAAAKRTLEAKRRKKQSDKSRKTRQKSKEKAKKEKKKARDDARKGKTTKNKNEDEEIDDEPEIMNPEVIAESKLFLLKNYVATKDDSFVSEWIENIEGDENFPSKLKQQFLAAKAQYYLNKQDFSKARTVLNELIKATSKNTLKARYHFILGQINEKQQNFDEANKSYKRVLGNNPDFDLEFYAKLNMAETAIKSSPALRSKSIRAIQKMLKDEKNEEYFGKLNYTLAMIFLSNNEEKKAIKSFKSAVKTSDNDAEQKALAFLKLGEIFYNNEDYVTSSSFYDSTMVVLPTTFADYKKIETRQEVLRELALQIKIIYFEDSLQRIAKMSEFKQNKVLDEIIERFEESAEAAKEESKEKDLKDLNPNKSTSSRSSRRGGSSFYFYNETQKTRGYNKFKERFGDITLADNWRVKSISETAGISFATLGDNAEEEILELAKEGKLSRELLLAQLPTTEEALQLSNNNIIEALYTSGNIYRNDIENEPKAIETFNDLIDRYPTNTYEVETHYQLYTLHKLAGNKDEMRKHQLRIERNFPTSVYAKLIENPNFLINPGDEFDSPKLFYKNSYDLYLEGEYEEVVARLEAASELFEVNELQPKYDFLRAQALSHIDKLNVYVSALNNVVSMHPKTDVETKAKEILAAITNGKKDKSSKTKNSKNDKEEDKKDIAVDKNKKAELEKVEYDKKKSAYKATKNEKHFFVIHFNAYNNTITKVLDEVSATNKTYFSLNNYDVKQMLIDKNNQIAIVRTYKNSGEAMAYYNRIVKEEARVFAPLEELVYTYFTISKTNFAAFFKTKGLAEYIAFFEATYLNK